MGRKGRCLSVVDGDPILYVVGLNKHTELLSCGRVPTMVSSLRLCGLPIIEERRCLSVDGDPFCMLLGNKTYKHERTTWETKEATTRLIALWQPSVHNDVAFWLFNVGSSYQTEVGFIK